MKFYVASSWKCLLQPGIVTMLRLANHEVYDFRNPAPGNHGFSWAEIDPAYEQWSVEQFREALSHPLALGGWARDFKAMLWADACVLVLPCGRSSHLEAGWFVGAKKPLIVVAFDRTEPENMYHMATEICTSPNEVFDAVEKLVEAKAIQAHEADFAAKCKRDNREGGDS